MYYYIANFHDRTYCLGKRLLYSQLKYHHITNSGDSNFIDNYIAIYLLKYYHTVNCLGERLLYSQFKGGNTTIYPVVRDRTSI